MIVHTYECNDCGSRYPIMPFYPVAAPHGPNKDCRAPQGWTLIPESYPPVTNNGGYPPQRD